MDFYFLLPGAVYLNKFWWEKNLCLPHVCILSSKGVETGGLLWVPGQSRLERALLKQIHIEKVSRADFRMKHRLLRVQETGLIQMLAVICTAVLWQHGSQATLGPSSKYCSLYQVSLNATVQNLQIVHCHAPNMIALLWQRVDEGYQASAKISLWENEPRSCNRTVLPYQDKTLLSAFILNGKRQEKNMIKWWRMKSERERLIRLKFPILRNLDNHR